MENKIEDGLIKVCAWCHPGETIYAVRPEWKGLGLSISHGMCWRHREQVLREANDHISKMKTAKVENTQP